MGTLSKVANTSPESYSDFFFRSFIDSRKKNVLGVSMIAVIGILLKMRSNMPHDKPSEPSVPKKKKSKGQIDMVFMQRIRELLKIVVPRLWSLEAFDMAQMMAFLVLRTFLSIYIAGINGKIVKSLIEVQFLAFVDKIVNLGLIAIPASFINSYLEYLNKRIALRFRRRITDHFLDRYL